MRARKRRQLVFWWILILLCVGVAAYILVNLDPIPEDEHDPALWGASLEIASREALDLVESHYGRPFAPRPAVHAVRLGVLASVAANDRLAYLRERNPGLPDRDLEALADHADCSPWTLVFYDAKSHAVYVLRRRMILALLIMGYLPEVRPRVLRLLLVQELALAMDQVQFGRPAPLDASSTEEAEVLRAVVDGHARYVMQHVAARTDDWSIFADWERELEAGRDEAAKFTYLSGRAFFTALGAQGRLDLESVFASPPRTRAELLNPETWKP